MAAEDQLPSVSEQHARPNGLARPCISQDSSMEMIKIVLQVLNSDQQLLCSVPRISKACKAAVETASPVTLAASVKGKKEIHAFIKWLSVYCSTPVTVRSGSLYMDSGDMSDAEQDEADALLAGALQRAKSEGCKLEFHKYCSTGFSRRSVLRSLLEETLTCLEVNDIRSKDMAAMLDISIGLRHLTKLDTLQLTFKEGDAGGLVLDVYTPAIAKLTNLTSLVLQGVDDFNHEQLIVPKLQRLLLGYYYQDIEKQHVAVFSHLTTLSYLSIQLNGEVDVNIGENVVLGPLPTQLVELGLDLAYYKSSADVGLNIPWLTRLERVSFKCSHESASDLLALRALPKLQHVDLSSYDSDSFIEASAAWPQLPQLHSVCLHDGLSVASLGQLMHNISLSTSLTRLVFTEEVSITGEGLMPPFCGGLAKLCGLQELCLCFEDVGQATFVARDVQQLSALTQLTHLHLNGPDKFVMEDDVVVLALQLRRLQALYVPVRSVLGANTLLAAICTGGDLRVVGIYADQELNDSLLQDAAWQRRLHESQFDVEVLKSHGYYS